MLLDCFCWLAAREVQLFLACFCRVRRHDFGAEPVKGSFILASNHISHFDPPALGAYYHRYIDWMAMEELFRNPASALLMRSLQAFPVKRERNDLLAMRAAIKKLQQGRVVGVFPEGGIRAGAGSVLEGAPFWPGVAALSALSGRPIVPGVILGSDRLYRPGNWSIFRRVPIWMGFGQPIYPAAAEPMPERRTDLQRRLALAFMDLRKLMQTFYCLEPADLPATPQARKRPDQQMERSSGRGSTTSPKQK
jgi:1-acyl-sn-glycerol-3-phosphate acyltransferase